jgi:S1-C subfamily serine protease
MRRLLAAAGVLAALAAAGCGGDDGNGPSNDAATRTVETTVTKVDVVQGLPQDGTFNAPQIYKEAAPGVVTVISIFKGTSGAAEGSGFVVSGEGEIVTNAHVVTQGTTPPLKPADEVYVEFGDGNQVPASVRGTDPNSDIALLRVDPGGLRLRPLRIGTAKGLLVGSPVAAIGSPFGEPQSLSVGVISGLERQIDSLTPGFSISGAVQTDAAINHGNSGGPLVDSRGVVLGVNAQIRSTGGGGEGVGFAIPADMVRRAVTQLRDKGRVDYAYLGVSTVAIFPQLAKRFKLPVERGAWVQEVVPNGPADKAGIKAGSREVRFQARPYRPGGDIIVEISGTKVNNPADVSEAIGRLDPGQKIPLVVVHSDGRRETKTVTLAERPTRAAATP